MDASLIYTFFVLGTGLFLLKVFGRAGVGEQPPTRNGKVVLRYHRGFIYVCHFVLANIILWVLGFIKVVLEGGELARIFAMLGFLLPGIALCFFLYRAYFTVEVEFDHEGVWKHGQFGEQFIAWQDITRLSTTRNAGSLSLFTNKDTLNVSHFSSGLGTFAGYVRRFAPEKAQEGYEELLYQLQSQTKN